MADVDTSTSPRSPEHAEQPVLLQNLEAFLADKLQMADRCACWLEYSTALCLAEKRSVLHLGMAEFV